MNMQMLAAAIAAVVAVIGWIVGHYLAAKRDRRNKLIDLRAQFLLDIHRRLERSVGKTVTREEADAIETALADLQLLGSPSQAHLARQFIAEWGGRSLNGISVGTILEDLRKSIREDLELEPVTEPIEHFRLYLNAESSHSA